MSKINHQKRVRKTRSVFSKEQQLAFIKECQATSLTVEAYAKENKLAASTLYRWADLSGVSLKSGKKNRTNREKDPIIPIKPELKEQVKADETHQLLKPQMSYVIQEFLTIIKDMAKGLIRRITGKNRS
ncbi:transposase [Candidatus Finniella inopinata]|uniref:Transposase n=1 Tax=Candidatus Finniella inopinata TaxID=1696036 RepID=A0A4V2DZL6_9PROT|nr:transposase [Candidatus Finniella inopinata]RZI45487.1 hypothetical protein EQU50_07005 [Candidatus Finniella inopinata]